MTNKIGKIVSDEYQTTQNKLLFYHLRNFNNALIYTSVNGSANNFKLIKVPCHKDAAIIQLISSVNTPVESLIIFRLERLEVDHINFDSIYALNIMNPFVRCPCSIEVHFRVAA